MKRPIAVLAATALFIIGGSSSAMAATSDDPGAGPGIETIPYDGPAFINDSEEAPVGAGNVSAGADTTAGDISPQCIVCGVPQYQTFKVSGPTLESQKFVRYLTGAWAKSTGYSWSTSTTVGATVTSGFSVSAASAASNIGVSSSVTKTYGITVNIAASSARYSKLGLASNFNKYYVKTALHQDGKLVSGATWKYGYLSSPTKDQYLKVYYQ